ncbi:MAG: glycine zipper domain-containing protein [Chlamydiota bacterium]
MKYIYIFSLLAVASFTSCATKTQTGALAGAGVGALAGGLIGGSATGALIGGAVGAAGGALIGYALDQQDRDNLQQQSPQTLNRIDHGQQLSTNDVKAMSKAGIKDDVIINQIHSTNSVFYLSADQIIDLKDSGVSQNVINYMIQTSN